MTMMNSPGNTHTPSSTSTEAIMSKAKGLTDDGGEEARHSKKEKKEKKEKEHKDKSEKKDKKKHKKGGKSDNDEKSGKEDKDKKKDRDEESEKKKAEKKEKKKQKKKEKEEKEQAAVMASGESGGAEAAALDAGSCHSEDSDDGLYDEFAEEEYDIELGSGGDAADQESDEVPHEGSPGDSHNPPPVTSGVKQSNLMGNPSSAHSAPVTGGVSRHSTCPGASQQEESLGGGMASASAHTMGKQQQQKDSSTGMSSAYSAPVTRVMECHQTCPVTKGGNHHRTAPESSLSKTPSTHGLGTSRHKPCPVARGVKGSSSMGASSTHRCPVTKVVKAKDPLGKSSTHSSSGSAHRPAATSAMVGKGIKYGVREVTIDELVAGQASFRVDGGGGGDDDDSDNSSLASIFWDNGERDIKNPVLRALVCCLVAFKCMPKDPADSTPMKNALRYIQWAALILDLSAAIVTIFSFSGNTMCCGSPILNVVGDAPWDNIIPIASYVYAALIVAEIYPVVSRGFPFNIINPLFGCALTIAMFFDDSVAMAVSVWCLEAVAVFCECAIYVLKVKQKKHRQLEIIRVGKLTKRKQAPDESDKKYDKEIKKVRRHYFQLKAERDKEHNLLWYLAVANIINIILIGSVLVLIIFVAVAGGLCIDMSGGAIPNPFASNQFATCSQCDPDPSKPCEVCNAEHNMCYYPYS